jgi:hypothetical protein
MKNNAYIFKNNKSRVVASLKKGNIDYVADSKWSFSDHFFAFFLSLSFFDFEGLPEGLIPLLMYTVI